MNLLDLTLFELNIFVKIVELNSLRECSRQLNLTPGHVSKALKRVESKMEAVLLKRSSKGMLLTPRGNHFYKTAKKFVELSYELSSDSPSLDRGEEKVVGIASMSFINTHLLPDCISKLTAEISRTRFRLMDVSRGSMMAEGLKGAFEVALHIGPLNWPKSWSSVKIGKLKSRLYGRVNHPLTSKATVEEVLHYPFVIPTYWTGEEFRIGDDQCPIPVSKRKHGHEVTTASTALSFISQTDQISFLPQLITSKLVSSYQINEIMVEGWENIGEDLYISVDNKSVKQTLRNSLVREIKKRI